jgi:hypothetical protein
MKTISVEAVFEQFSDKCKKDATAAAILTLAYVIDVRGRELAENLPPGFTSGDLAKDLSTAFNDTPLRLWVEKSDGP